MGWRGVAEKETVAWGAWRAVVGLDFLRGVLLAQPDELDCSPYSL